jgi:zinc protease
MKTRKFCVGLAIIVAILFVSVSGWSAPGQDVLRATLANGLRVIIVQSKLAPVATTQLNYLAGANESPEGFPGMAHAQEHMMFRGSPGLSAEQLAGIIALTGGEFNADTEQTVTQYHFTVAREHLDIALNVEAIRMRGVLDSQELWEQERGAIEQEVARDLSNPEYVFSTRLTAELFAGTPYAHDALGTRPSFQQTTGVMLKEFYDRWYAPNNAVLVIVGDVDLQKTLTKVKELFEPIPRRPLPVRPAVALQPLKPAAIALDTDLPYGLSVVAYRLPGFDSPDFAAATILADVLDSQRGNLYALVPNGKALSAGFEGEILPKAGYGYAMAAFPQGDDGNALVAAIKEIISGYVNDGIPPDLVEAVKRHEVSNAEFRKNSVTGLASAWSQAIAIEGRNSPEDDIETIKRVTVDDVNRVARAYLSNNTATTAVLTPHLSEKPMASKGYGGGESFAPNKVTAVTLPAWARKAEIIPGVPPSKVKPVIILLPNGIRLIVQFENISPTVTVIGRVKNNDHLQEPAGKEGVSLLLNNLFSRGTLSMDRLALQKAQDDIGADISAGASFSLRVLSESFDRGMELLAENLLRPALPEAEFITVKEEAIGSLRGQLKSPRYLSGRALREGLFPEPDPALRDATPETVATVSLPDVKAYYAKVFRPDMTTIVVIGNVTAKRVRTVVEKYFSAWKAAGQKPKTDLPAVPPNRPSQSLVPDISGVQDSVTLAQTIGVTRKHPDYYTLELGNHVLSGAFYASRLYRDLREKSGLVYTVGSAIEAGKNRSLFRISYGCDPPNVAKARAIVEKNLRNMQTTPVTSDELRRAKILLLRQITLAEASTDSIAMTLLTRSQQDLPLDEPRHAARLYRKMTARQVREAFAKWIRPADFVQVTVGPDPQ